METEKIHSKPEPIHYKSDFDFTIQLTDRKTGEPAGFPGYSFTARIYTNLPDRAFVASYDATTREAVNCFDDNGLVHFVLDRHGLHCGSVTVELTELIPDAIFPDGVRTWVRKLRMPIELRNDVAEVPSGRVSVSVPVVVQTAYDIAAAQGYGGTAEEYNAAVTALPRIAAEAQELVDYMAEYRAGKRAIAEALRSRGVAVSASDSMEDIAAAVRRWTPEVGDVFAPLGYTADDVAAVKKWLLRDEYAAKEAYDKDGVAPTGSLRFAPRVDWHAENRYFGGSSSWLYLPQVTLLPSKQGDGYAFQNSSVKVVGSVTAVGLHNFHCFASGSSIRRVECLDIRQSPVVSQFTSSHMASFGSAVMEFIVVNGIGVASGCPMYNLSQMAVWGTKDEECRQSVVDTLLTHSVDVAAQGRSVTVKLSQATFGCLTTEELALITEKGYTVTM